MQTKFKIDKKLDYINLKEGMMLSYSADDTNALRGVDHLGRILFIKQFNNQDELYQFLCGMTHVLEEE